MAVFDFHFLSNILQAQVAVRMILPTFEHPEIPKMSSGDYYKPGMKYKTLWLLHGFGDDYTCWTRYTAIERYAQENKLMVIMPDARKSFYADTQYGYPFWTFLTTELPDIIKTNIRTYSDKREDNFIAGFSMGASGAMKYGINFPERFSQVYCLSGATMPIETLKNFSDKTMKDITYIYGDVENIRGTCDDVYDIARQKVKEGHEMPTFHFAVGTDDSLIEIVRDGYKRLKDTGCETQLCEVQGYAHEWKFWNLYIRKVIYELMPITGQPIY